MLDKKQKLLEIRTNKLVDSLFIGNYKTNIKGNGIEYADYKEYDYSDNVKNIDFLRSEKEGKTLVKLFEEERDLSVYFIIDINPTFFEEYNDFQKIDLVYEIFYLIGLSAIKSGDKLGIYIFNDLKKKISFAKKGKQNFVDLVNIIGSFTSNETNPEITNTSVDGLKYFNSLKIKKSVVFYLTDNLDINNKDLKILGLKNDLILCNIFNSFENNLNMEGIKKFGIGDFNLSIDLDNNKKKSEYIKLRNEKIGKLKKQVYKTKGRYLLFDESTDSYNLISKLFKNK